MRPSNPQLQRGLGAALCSLVAYGCVDLEATTTSKSCAGCVPMCAAGVDPEDLDGAAQRLHCDPELVQEVWPPGGWMVREQQPEITIELSRSPSSPRSGRGCEGPVRLRRIGSVGRYPEAVAADIVTHASLHSLPLWPRERQCVEASWSIRGNLLRLTPVAPLERFVWYEVQVDGGLEFDGPGLCSELQWRFAVSGCGNGVVESALSFTDWVCLGRPEAERGGFDPYNEECDDGNQENKDGCLLCLREAGFRCDEHGCHTRCGDAIKAGDEECDFGIHQTPGCSAQCEIEPGYECDFNGCRPLAGGQ